ncbi:MAG TPA: nucleotide sugar dehydrogenase [Dehalococcoidia bacterium]|nr:nucleotide sugar dehydrogenase [Dehalococcoidia bacterium]
MGHDLDNKFVCVVGLGYVGLPLAEAFAAKLRVIGFDVDSDRVRKLKESNGNGNLTLTDDPKEIGRADFVIICVPTPLTRSREPDLSYVISAARTVSQNMKRGSVIIVESTYYPGVTEEVVKPILEESGFRCGDGFKIAYSPERVNPGDSEHEIGKISKVVSGMDVETAEMVAQLYSRITDVYIARDIRTAEAAKVIENIQRDLNIALMNELSLIFERMGLSTEDVLDAAATKWNFVRYAPGLVGGHCIPVDPYYLVHKARALGYYPQVVLAGRAINDYMAKHVAEMMIKALNEMGRVIKGSKVLVMGLTYKENVPDIRETPAKAVIGELKGYGVDVYGYDPLLDGVEIEFGIKAVTDLNGKTRYDGIILTVAHQAFEGITLGKLAAITNSHPVLIDVRGYYDGKEAVANGFYYRTL